MNKLLKIGEPAPFFTLASYNVGTVDLQALLGRKKIVLIFSRYFGCPICRLDLLELIENAQKIIEKNTFLIYITQSGSLTANQIIKDLGITFPVIYGAKEGIYTNYGLRMMSISTLAKVPNRLKEAKMRGIEHGPSEGWEAQSPGQFILDEQGKIIHLKSGWLDLPAIFEVLNS
jgi:peroxiredoxin Q/BCP